MPQKECPKSQKVICRQSTESLVLKSVGLLVSEKSTLQPDGLRTTLIASHEHTSAPARVAATVGTARTACRSRAGVASARRKNR